MGSAPGGVNTTAVLRDPGQAFIVAGRGDRAMMPRERLLTALNRGIPDRLPVMEMAIDGKVIRGAGAADYFDLVERLDLEGVAANQVAYLLGIRGAILRRVRTFTDPWGVPKRVMGELLPYAISHPVRTAADLDRLQPPDPRRDPVLAAVRETARRLRGRRAVVFVVPVDFAAAWNLCGMERLLTSYIDEPSFARRISALVLDYSLALCRLAVREGADVVVLSDDYAHKTGPLMSPAQFREFVLPFLAEAVGSVRATGALCVKHTDGDVRGLLEDIVGTGVDGIGPLEPGAGMDLGEVKRRHGSRVAVVGSVDVDLLCRGSVEEVRSATRALIGSVSAGGGHVLSSANTITSAVRPENFVAMVRTARELGRYPIAAHLV
jgi:uroporphyrinogen decarboxylase